MKKKKLISQYNEQNNFPPKTKIHFSWRQTVTTQRWDDVLRIVT